MIILEGPDGSGKSTLSERISRAYGGIPVHNIGRTPGTPEGVRENIQACYDRADDLCIQDRVTQISEPIYGAVFGRELITPFEFREAQAQLIMIRKPVIIYCRVDDLDKVVHTREQYDSFEDHQAVSENLMRIRFLYDETFSGSLYQDADIITYDYTTDDVEELIDVQLFARIPRLA
jgi:archaellum biogenesis ATPase FlaH